MSIVDVQNAVNQKITDNQVGAITPERLREAFNAVIAHMTELAGNIDQIAAVMAHGNDLQALSTNLTALSTDLATLNNFVMTPQAAIGNLSETPPTLSLSLLSLNVLGTNQADTNKAINKILAALRNKKVIASA